MIGLGCDLIHVDRIERAMQNPRFMERVFTTSEREHTKKGASSAAGIWAAKEAISKALGTGFVGFSLTDTEVVFDGLGKPCVRLHGGAKKRMEYLGGKAMFVSISHEGGVAMAVCVLE